MPLPDDIRDEFERVAEHFQLLRRDAEARGDMDCLGLVLAMSEVMTMLGQWNEKNSYGVPGMLTVRRATTDIIDALVKGLQGL